MREDDWHPRSRARRRNAHTVWAKSCTGRKSEKVTVFSCKHVVDVKNGKAHPRQRMGLGSHNQCAQCGSVLCLVLGLVNLTVATPYTATDLYGLLSLSCARTGKF